MGEIQEGGDAYKCVRACVCVCVADSHCCTTESNAILQNNYIPILKDKFF